MTSFRMLTGVCWASLALGIDLERFNSCLAGRSGPCLVSALAPPEPLPAKPIKNRYYGR